MLDELKRLFDDRIDIDRELFSLALMREFEQAVCDRLAPERFIANNLQILAEVLMQLHVLQVLDPRGQRLRAGGDGS